jgi:hypothetical protein
MYTMVLNYSTAFRQYHMHNLAAVKSGDRRDHKLVHFNLPIKLNGESPRTALCPMQNKQELYHA